MPSQSCVSGVDTQHPCPRGTTWLAHALYLEGCCIDCLYTVLRFIYFLRPARDTRTDVDPVDAVIRRRRFRFSAPPPRLFRASNRSAQQEEQCAHRVTPPPPQGGVGNAVAALMTPR